MDIEPQNQTANNSEKTQNSSRITTIGAWMVVIGLITAGFSFNEYVKNHKIAANENNFSADEQFFKEIAEKVIPQNGYEINAKWNDVGPNLIKSGVIDPEEFKKIYLDNGGLSPQELTILENGSDSKIKITKENSHFILNMLWAFGLGQQNKLLTEGEMVKYEDYKRFASTGGWSIAAKPIEEFYSKFNWLNLTLEQEEKIKNIATNVYRPCCNNSTAFPDCNHGMAALGLIEIMVANNIQDEEIYKALKYFNSFWFASSYMETAIYFKQIKGIDWDNADAKEILSKQYSSSGGWAKNIRAELEKTPELLPQNKEGAGCGV